jgi:hypothetical protein
LWGPDTRTRGVDEAYLAEIKEQITQTILQALAAQQPARVKAAVVHAPGLARNNRQPNIVDDELTLLQFVGPAGEALVTLYNFPCHPEVLWEHNPQITADYVHPLRQVVEQQTGGACIFFSGALGGMMTPAVKDHSFEEATAMGHTLAETGLQALAAAPVQAPVGLSLQKQEIKVKLTNILYKLAFWRKLLPDVRDPQGYIHSEVNLIRLGETWLATVPGELLPGLGMELKKWMMAGGAQVAGVIGLANDELGYILPVEDFKYPWNPFKPGNHYEETNSVGKDSAPRVMEALRTLISSRPREGRAAP